MYVETTPPSMHGVRAVRRAGANAPPRARPSFGKQQWQPRQFRLVSPTPATGRARCGFQSCATLRSPTPPPPRELLGIRWGWVGGTKSSRVGLYLGGGGLVDIRFRSLGLSTSKLPPCVKCTCTCRPWIAGHLLVAIETVAVAEAAWQAVRGRHRQHVCALSFEVWHQHNVGVLHCAYDPPDVAVAELRQIGHAHQCLQSASLDQRRQRFVHNLRQVSIGWRPFEHRGPELLGQFARRRRLRSPQRRGPRHQNRSVFGPRAKRVYAPVRLGPRR